MARYCKSTVIIIKAYVMSHENPGAYYNYHRFEMSCE